MRYHQRKPVLPHTYRALYVTQDGNDAKQTLSLSNTPETIIFNEEQWASPLIQGNLAAGEFTYTWVNDLVLTVSVEIIRELTGAGDLTWTMFVEVSDDNGANWIQFPGSSRTISMATQSANERKIVDFTVAIASVKNRLFRLRHSTSDATKNVSVISSAASNGNPSSAGVIIGFYGVA